MVLLLCHCLDALEDVKVSQSASSCLKRWDPITSIVFSASFEHALIFKMHHTWTAIHVVRPTRFYRVDLCMQDSA